MKKLIIIDGKKTNISDLKHFTKSDLVIETYKKINIFHYGDLVENPLWWHKQNLSQTATGYGSKLTTSKMIYFENKLRRIYCTIYSNSGTTWFTYKGEEIIVNNY